MERTEYFEDLVVQMEEKYPKNEIYEEEEEEIDEKEDEFLMKMRYTQDDVQNEIDRINPILENKIKEEGFDWVFKFVEKLNSEEIVWLETDQMENMWKFSHFYIPSTLNLVPQPAKYVNSRRDILKGRIRSLPTIKWVYRNEDDKGIPFWNGVLFSDPSKDGSKKTIGFEVMDGRHRLANWRDMGIKKVPVRIEREFR